MNLIVYRKNLIYSLIFGLIGIILIGEKYIYIAIPSFLGMLILLESISYSVKKGGSFFHPYCFTATILIWVLVCSPIISIYYDRYLFNPPKEVDWIKWTSILTWIYLALIINYYLIGRILLKNIKRRNIIFIKKNRVIVVISLFFLIFSFICQIIVFIKFGGIGGYMETWSEDRTQFDGLGILFMLAEPFPILALLVLCLFFRGDNLKNPLLFIVCIFLIFFALKMIFGGFRGSRSNTIWGLFWFAGIIHIYYFRLKSLYFILGILFLIVFMNLYSLYKSFGIDAFSLQYSLSDTGRFDDNPTVTILLNDFSRVGLHAYMLAQYYDYNFYEIKFGQTYLYSLSKILPLWDEYTVYSKNSAGSEILYGRKSSLVFQDYHNSRIFGAYGEAFLNFGPILAILIFSFYSFLIVQIDNISRLFSKYDPFFLLTPFLSNLSLMLLLTDSDNLIFFFFKNGMLVMIFLALVRFFGVKKKVL